MGRKRRNQTKASVSSVNHYSDKNEHWFQLGGGEVARAAQSSPVEAAVSLIANDISTLDFYVYEELEDGTYRKANGAENRVIRKPNDFSTTTDLLNRFVRDVYYYGNAYLYADRNNRNEIIALYNIRPNNVIPYVADDGSVYYSVGLTSLEAGSESLEPIMVPARDVLHHRVFWNTHPLKGISPLYAIGGSATMNAAISENMANFHANNSRPGGVLSIPGGLKQDARERLRREFQQQFGGSGAGKTAVLDFDVKWNPMGYSAQESSVVELLKYSVEDVCRALRIPKHMMGIDTSLSTTSSELAMRQYYSHCLRPMIESIESRFDDFFGLIGTRFEFEFDINELFRAETALRVDALSKAVQGGIMTPNEARASESLPPIDGGDTAFLQRQMTPINLLTTIAANEANPPAAPAAPATEQNLNYYDMIMKMVGGSKAPEPDYAAMILKELA